MTMVLDGNAIASRAYSVVIRASNKVNKSTNVRFQVLTAASMMIRAVFWVILLCKMIVDKHFTRQYNPEDSSEHQKYEYEEYHTQKIYVNQKEKCQKQTRTPTAQASENNYSTYIVQSKFFIQSKLRN
jgi:hypothetical protein